MEIHKDHPNKNKERLLIQNLLYQGTQLLSLNFGWLKREWDNCTVRIKDFSSLLFGGCWHGKWKQANWSGTFYMKGSRRLFGFLCYILSLKGGDSVKNVLTRSCHFWHNFCRDCSLASWTPPLGQSSVVLVCLSSIYVFNLSTR